MMKQKNLLARPRHRYGLVFCVVGMGAMLSCDGSTSNDAPFRIVPAKPLTASLGQDIEWTFNGSRGSRPMQIVDISFNDLPLGVTKVRDGKTITLRGKVQTRDVRTGLIRVTAYDEKACNESYEQLKKMTTEQVKATGNTDTAIPTSPCKLDGGRDYGLASQFMGQAYFNWSLVDGADAIAIASYPKFIADNLFKPSFKSPLDGMLEIPSREAPDSGDVILGQCAARPRKLCGKDSNCLWGLTSCISKDATGRIPADASLATGTQPGSMKIMINGDLKQ